MPVQLCSKFNKGVNIWTVYNLHGISYGSNHNAPANILEDTLKYHFLGGGKEVCISGSFSNWETIPMVKSHGDFVTIVDLPEGEHHYRYYVDGEWKNDPHNRIVDGETPGKGKVDSCNKGGCDTVQNKTLPIILWLIPNICMLNSIEFLPN